jgi:hypothetical protein
MVLATGAAAVVVLLSLALSSTGAAARREVRSQQQLPVGTIHWLFSHLPRGESLLAAHIALGSTVGAHWQPVQFARVLTPEPNSEYRVVVSLIGKHGHNICLTLFHQERSVSGGCAFGSALRPFSAMTSTDSSTSTEEIDGLASDEVAKISLILPSGRSLSVPLKDNAFLITVSRIQGLSKLVAYNQAGSVITSTPQRPIPHLPG